MKAGRFQAAVLCEPAEPILPPSGQAPDHILGQVPGIEHDHAKGCFVPNGLFDPFDGPRHFRLTLFVSPPKRGILEHHRIDLLRQAIPPLRIGRNLEGRKMLGHRGFPLGQFLIAAIQAQAQGEAPRATDVQAGHRMMGQRGGTLAVVVVAGHVVKETADRFTQGIVNHHERLPSSVAMGCRLLEHEPDAAAIDFILTPGRFREKAREVSFVGAVEDAPGDIGHALVGRHDQTAQIVLEMPKLALVVQEVAEDHGLLADHGSRRYNRQLHHEPPCPWQPFRLGARVAC